MEQLVQREAVGGRYVPTRKLSKLANNYSQPYLHHTERLGKDYGENDEHNASFLDELVTVPPAARI